MNEEAKSEEQAPAFGPGTKTDDITIDYKPAEKPEEPGKSGEDGEADGSEGSGETDETENPDGTYVKGDVIDNSKKDEATGKDGKIGTATKEETPDSSSSTTVVDPDAEVKKGDPVVGKDEDGNTTITTPTETTGTETTTTTGTGKADSSTTITDTKKGEKINLDDELGKDVRPNWKTDKDDKLGGYTVDKVEPAEDGNSKELTLKKASPTEEKEMAAEDIAKLLDVPEGGVEKKEELDEEGNPKTTYTLKKEETSTDENGNTVTRVTYYEITGTSVKTRTETTLKLKVEKGTDKRTEILDTPIQQPDINDEEAKNVLLPSGKLESILEDSIKKDDNTYTYTETIPNEDGITIREYTITKTDEARDLTYQELAERLGEGFTADQDGVYYKGEKLTFEQMEAKRHALRYQVQIKETHKTFDQVSGKTEAETAAKTEAIKGALRNAAKKYDITLTEDDLKDIKLTGGDLTVTREGKTYTFHYTEAGVEYSTPTSTGETTVDGKEAEDVKETTVTGTAYVTKGTISWSKTDQEGSFTQSVVDNGSSLEAMPQRPDINDPSVKYVKKDDGTEVYTVTTKKDGITTETIYTFKTEKDVTLTDPEKEAAAWKALAEAEHKSVEDLQKEGYKIDNSTFNKITKTSWTVETKTHSTKETNESLNQKILKAEGDPTWTLEGTTLKIKDGDTYKDLKKNADGTYTATKEEDGKTITYTFTLGVDKSLDGDTIKAMLAKEFNVSVDAIELKDGKATYKDGETTVTIDYSNLSKKTLKIDKSVSEAVSVTDTIKTDQDLKDAQERLYQELKKKVESIHLNEGEELWIGDLHIKDIKTQKEEIIEHFTTAVSHENMSQQALIAALNAQAEESKTTKVTVNKGTKYEETLNNYYSGDKKFEHSPKDPPWYREPGKGDNITHLDLASGAKMDKLPGKDGKVTTTDCVLLAKNQKLEWNYDADKLVKGDGNTTVGLKKYISKDTEDGTGYHYEYDRLRGEGENKNPERSAFYKLTGTVAYDAVKDNKTGKVKTYYDYGSALDAYLEATGKTRQDFSDDEWAAIYGTYVVPITSPGFPVDHTSYQVYTKTAEMTSYGYMTRDANTCVNATFGRQYEDSWFTDEWDYVGGYDLMISDLVQVSEGKVVGQTQSSIKTLWAPLAIRSTQSLENKSLQLNAKHTSTPVTTIQNLGSGYEEEGSFTYDVSYKHTDTYTDNCNKGVQGTGTGKYKTFTQLLKEKFSGKGETSYDEGKVSYTHRTTDKVNTTPVSKETVTTTDAHVGYNYTSIETRTVTVNGEETVIVPPVTPPETPVEDETPDEVVMTPETPELPPVQDATPDAPVLPSDAVLPAVQDALPQTGVNWMAALGMAFSGMLLTIAGAFASLKYKEKH